jgi:hypothetical protein
VKELSDEATSDNACSIRDAAREWACNEPNRINHSTSLQTTIKHMEIKTSVYKEHKTKNVKA